MFLLPFAMIALTTPKVDEALLDDLQHRAVRFFWNESNPKTGFTKDRASNFKSDSFNVASCAATGFALAAYPIGVERKWLMRKEALARTKITLRNLLETHQGYKGFFYHFVNWETGKREWNSELSSIDTAILLAGAIVAREYWKDPEVVRLADRIINAPDWKWMMTDGGAKPNEVFVSMGWDPAKGFIDARWFRHAYSEESMLYIFAYGSRPKLTTEGWDKGRREIVRYKGLEFLTGGPLFMHQMSHGFIDFSEKRDRLGFNYWFSTQQNTLANRAYCIENPKGFKAYGENFWGLSASDSPDGYRAFGIPNMHDDNGTITPTCVAASMPFTPSESMACLENMKRKYPDAYGRYGFSNAINPTRDWVGPDVIGIDLGMMLVGVENYRSGLIHRLTSKNEVVKKGMDRLGFHTVAGSNKGPLQAR